MAAGRPIPPPHLAPGGITSFGPGSPYFDSNALQVKERSTVGSASATGSVGGRTTWASGSVDYDVDKMSEDQDDGVSSTGGFSDEGNASLVGFGEGASSTLSGPVSTGVPRMLPGRQNPTSAPSVRAGLSSQASQQDARMSGTSTPEAIGNRDPRMMDGMSYDANIIDTTMQPAPPIGQPQQPRVFSGAGTELAESILRNRLTDPDPRPMGTPDSQHLGKFPFEKD